VELGDFNHVQEVRRHDARRELQLVVEVAFASPQVGYVYRQAEGRVAGRLCALDEALRDVAFRVDVELEPAPAFGGRRDIFHRDGGHRAQDHDGTCRCCGASRRLLALRVRSAQVCHRGQEDGRGHGLPQHFRGGVDVRDAGEDAGQELDAAPGAQVAGEGDLIFGAAGDEVVYRLLQLLSRHHFIVADIYGCHARLPRIIGFCNWNTREQ
jgi:hypothetical protein